jgi:hypothetical protein
LSASTIADAFPASIDVSNQPILLIGRPTRLYFDTDMSPAAAVIVFRRLPCADRTQLTLANLRQNLPN